MGIKNKLQRIIEYMQKHGLKPTLKKIMQKIYNFVKIHILKNNELQIESENYISWQKNKCFYIESY